MIGASARLSAVMPEVSDPRLVGTALAPKLGPGSGLTVVSIRLTPVLAGAVGWRWTFLYLVPGSVMCEITRLVLRSLPESRQVAPGLR